MTENAYFGPILAVFGPKILIFRGVSESFGTNITENHLGNLSALFFAQALDQMGQKCRCLAKNASFGPNLVVFGPKIQFFGGREKNFWYPHIGNPMRHLFCVENIDRGGSNWPLGAKMCFFYPKIWIFGAKSRIFGIVIAIFVNGANNHYTQGYNFPLGTTPQKNFCFRARGHFLGLTPVFGRFGPFPR